MKKMVLLPYERYQHLLLCDQPPEAKQEDPVTSIQAEKPLDTNGLPPKVPLMKGKIRRRLLHDFQSPCKTECEVCWNIFNLTLRGHNKGEVSIRDKAIPGSKIVDLLKVHLKDYKDFNPVGIEAFQMLL